MNNPRKPNRFAAKRKRMQALGQLAPRFGIAIGPQFPMGSDYSVVLPFRRSPVVILISGVFLAIFALPLLSVVGGVTGQLEDNLFSLVAFLFGLFWALGWSVGVFILAAVFLAVTFGRETLAVKDSELILRIGFPMFGFGARYSPALIRNFRRQQPDEVTGTGWRGEHLAFDYAGDTIGFGSAIGGAQAQQMLDRLEQLFPQSNDPLPQLPKVEIAPVGKEKAEIQHATLDPFAQEESIRWHSMSSLALIAANLFPLFGILFLDWEIGEIMLLFWAESAVIGFYNLLKMAQLASWAILFYGPFFVGHYGGFMVGHLLFIYAFFGDNLAEGADISISELVADMLRLAPALLGFFLSHGISYFTNFRGRHEYIGRNVGAQMGQPYKRIIIMHITIIFGGFLVMLLETALPALLLLIVLKLSADLRAHLKEHGNPTQP
ncbi:MAG: DUF6498-containing protein [Pseudomonadales bacterium]|nr:DUF6498-containing protein [Pseudomonadales bacterium]